MGYIMIQLSPIGIILRKLLTFLIESTSDGIQDNLKILDRYMDRYIDYLIIYMHMICKFRLLS